MKAYPISVNGECIEIEVKEHNSFRKLKERKTEIKHIYEDSNGTYDRNNEESTCCEFVQESE